MTVRPDTHHQQGDTVAEPERQCGHCREPMRGFASFNDVWLCHPDDGLDCYRMVTIYKHLMPCFQCASIHYDGGEDVAIAEQMLPAGVEVLPPWEARS